MQNYTWCCVGLWNSLHSHSSPVFYVSDWSMDLHQKALSGPWTAWMLKHFMTLPTFILWWANTDRFSYGLEMQAFLFQTSWKISRDCIPGVCCSTLQVINSSRKVSVLGWRKLAHAQCWNCALVTGWKMLWYMLTYYCSGFLTVYFISHLSLFVLLLEEQCSSRLCWNLVCSDEEDRRCSRWFVPSGCHFEILNMIFRRK